MRAGLPAGRGVAVAVMVAGATLLTDLLTHSVNLSILYTIPIYVLAVSVRARWVVLLSLMMVGAAYVGLFLGPRPAGLETAHALLHNYRFVNRTFAAFAILGTGVVASWQRNWSERMNQRVDDELLHDRSIYLDMLDQVRFLATLLIALAITASLIAVDWTTSAEFNFPILYGVPLVLCVLSGSARTIWLMAPLLVVLTWVGFYISNDNLREFAPWLNRSIATLMLMALAVVGTVRARRGR